MSSTELALTTAEETKDVIAQIETAFWDIPFENSDYQNKTFVVSAQITPERAYRSIGLKMLSKLQALRAAQFAARKRDITLGELQEKIESSGISKWDKMRAEVEIEEIQASVNYNNKLINDAIRELNVLYAHFEALPKFTREQFEAAEETYFRESLQRQLTGIVGAKASLTNMNQDTPALANYEAQVNLIENADSETLEQLRLGMNNRLPASSPPRVQSVTTGAITNQPLVK